MPKKKVSRKKRKTSKRKTSKRKTSKRKTSKRKTSKRKTSRRKTSRRKTSRRKTSRRKRPSKKEVELEEENEYYREKYLEAKEKYHKLKRKTDEENYISPLSSTFGTPKHPFLKNANIDGTCKFHPAMIPDARDPYYASSDGMTRYIKNTTGGIKQIYEIRKVAPYALPLSHMSQLQLLNAVWWFNNTNNYYVPILHSHWGNILTRYRGVYVDVIRHYLKCGWSVLVKKNQP